VTARASLTDASLDFEVDVPFAALGAGAGKPGDRWRILPIRNLRTGTNVQAPMPYAHRGGFGAYERMPVFTLAEAAPYVQVQPMQQALYAGRPMVRLRLVNPSAETRRVTVSLRVLRGDRAVGKIARDVPLPPAESMPVTLVAPCDPPLDPNAEAEYRCVLDVTGPGGTELLHTHFTWNPTENREWLGEALPAPRRATERVLVIDPRQPVPFQFQRFMRYYKDLPEDHRLHITTVRVVVPGKGFVVDSVQHITPVGPSGQKDGVETFYRLGYMREHSITWREGVRHGPEKFYAYARKVIPWVNGEVCGVQQVFHPTGELLAETRYEKGQAVGTARRYDSEGRLIRTTRFEGGLMHGEMAEYYARRPRRVVLMRDGVIHGVVKEYDWAGHLVRKTPYRDGVPHGIEEFRPDIRYPLVWEKVYWHRGEKVSEDRWNELTGQTKGKQGKEGRE